VVTRTFDLSFRLCALLALEGLVVLMQRTRPVVKSVHDSIGENGDSSHKPKSFCNKKLASSRKIYGVYQESD
jgi:hypothetical protein